MVNRPRPGSKAHNIRIPDELWEAAQTKAEASGTTVSAVIREYLQRWVKN